MALAKKPTDSFFNTKSIHPHLRLHILLSILAVAVVLGSVGVYRIKTDSNYEQGIIVPVSHYSTSEELRLIAEKISSGPSESPPTQAEMERMASKISKTNTGKSTLSTNDLELQAQILNK